MAATMVICQCFSCFRPQYPFPLANQIVHPLLHLFPVVNQFYKAEILTEYVIRGNTAVLKCSIPSFVADYVQVDAWLDDSGRTLTATAQDYGLFDFDSFPCSRDPVLPDGSGKRVCDQG